MLYCCDSSNSWHNNADCTCAWISELHATSGSTCTPMSLSLCGTRRCNTAVLSVDALVLASDDDSVWWFLLACPADTTSQPTNQPTISDPLIVKWLASVGFFVGCAKFAVRCWSICCMLRVLVCCFCCMVCVMLLKLVLFQAVSEQSNKHTNKQSNEQTCKHGNKH